jgi:DNA-binding transcriptional LysR family regulator
MELDPRRLRVLRAVAVRGGVMEAARLLHLTPSAVSQQLTQLEREVGIALLDRSRRRISLTAAGQLLAGRAERIEQELVEARQELAALSGRVSGPLVVASFPTALCHLLVPAFTALAGSHPDVRPSAIELEGAAALHELRTGTVDVVITEGDGPEPARPGLANAAFAEDGYRIAVPRGWPDPRTVRDLADRPWVAGPPESACGQALDRLGARHRFTPRRAHVCLNFPGVLALVAAGFGAAIVPGLALSDVPAGAVTVTGLPVGGSRRLTAVCRAPRSGPEPVTAVLIDALDTAAQALGLTPAASTPH